MTNCTNFADLNKVGTFFNQTYAWAGQWGAGGLRHL